MSLTLRSYRHPDDYALVDRFLIEQFRPATTVLHGIAADGGPLPETRMWAYQVWPEPRWEYMHAHPLVESVDLSKIGIVEEDGRIAGVVHPEHGETFVYLQAPLDRDDVKRLLVDHALDTLGGPSETFGGRVLGLYVNEFDLGLRRIVQDSGFEITDHGEPHARYLLDRPVPDAPLPPGYRLHRLADGVDLAEVNEVLWHGFNHPGPAPDDEIPGRQRIKESPNFRPDLTFVAVAPDGHYASYSGMWHVPENRMGYVEPVATHPDHRRLGLGRACVLACLRAVADEGAGYALVGSDQAFYTSMGFTVEFRYDLWIRRLD